MIGTRWPELVGIAPEAVGAWASLCVVLDAMAEAGQVTACASDPEAWTSERTTDREAAAVACSWCPARVVCRDFAEANAEAAHVWGGHDHTPRPRDSEETACATPQPPTPPTTPPASTRPRDGGGAAHAAGARATSGARGSGPAGHPRAGAVETSRATSVSPRADRRACRWCEATPSGCQAWHVLAGRWCCEACDGDHDPQTGRSSPGPRGAPPGEGPSSAYDGGPWDREKILCEGLEFPAAPAVHPPSWEREVWDVARVALARGLRKFEPSRPSRALSRGPGVRATKGPPPPPLGVSQRR